MSSHQDDAKVDALRETRRPLAEFISDMRTRPAVVDRHSAEIVARIRDGFGWRRGRATADQASARASEQITEREETQS